MDEFICDFLLSNGLCSNKQSKQYLCLFKNRCEKYKKLTTKEKKNESKRTKNR